MPREKAAPKDVTLSTWEESHARGIRDGETLNHALIVLSKQNNYFNNMIELETQAQGWI